MDKSFNHYVASVPRYQEHTTCKTDWNTMIEHSRLTRIVQILMHWPSKGM